MKRTTLTESSYPDQKAQFIVDAKGNKKQVVLDIDQFEELLETLEDYYDIAQAAILKNKKEKTKSLAVIKKKLLG